MSRKTVMPARSSATCCSAAYSSACEFHPTFSPHSSVTLKLLATNYFPLVYAALDCGWKAVWAVVWNGFTNRISVPLISVNSPSHAI